MPDAAGGIPGAGRRAGPHGAVRFLLGAGSVLFGLGIAMLGMALGIAIIISLVAPAGRWCRWRCSTPTSSPLQGPLLMAGLGWWDRDAFCARAGALRDAKAQAGTTRPGLACASPPPCSPPG